VELTLDKNMISVIPNAIGKLKKLEEFSIKENRCVPTLVLYISLSVVGSCGWDLQLPGCCV